MTDERIDRYARGELTAAESRALAQESLDAPELFDELTYSALAKTALSTRTAGAKVLGFPRKARFIAAIAAAAAAVVAVSLYSVRPARRILPLTPALSLSAKPGQPILLASAAPSQTDLPVFRGLEPGGRAPLAAGAVVSIENGLATVNLGSLDGLAKGAELQIFPDEHSTEPAGRLVVTTVFRERARGRSAGGRVHLNDRVRVPSAEHLTALLDHADALFLRGDKDAARITAEKALQWAESSNVPPGDKRKAQDRVAALSNDLAVLSMLRGDYAAAEAPLTRAASFTYARSVNNLGVLAELRGDIRKAQALYAGALRAYADAPDSPAEERHAVETNLARVKGSR